MTCFIELLKAQFEKNANRPALKYGETVLTYAELKKKVESTAAFLQSAGMQKGDRVILYTPDKFSFLQVHLGIIAAGGISLPLNFDFTAHEMEYYINDSGARFAAASGEYGKTLQSIKEKCPCLERILDPAEAAGGGNGELFREPDIKPEDPCFMLYSSGTTGQPKGVVHSHENLAKSVSSLSKCWRFTPDDILLNVLPLFHIHGLSFATHTALISGSCTVIEEKFHPVKTMDRIKDATVFMAVPTIYYDFLKMKKFREKAKDWTEIRLFTCGSAPIRPEVLPELESILGSNIINRYGMTESHVITSLPLDGPFVQGSVGLPLEGVEMKLLTEDGREIPCGTKGKKGEKDVGEVKIKGPNLFSTYWNKPDAMKKDFDKDGFFSTGDLGYFDENGFLTLVSRKKDLIISGGYNVYPPVIERVLNENPLVKESAVIGIPDELKGENVMAVVVPEDGFDLNELKQYCRKKLVKYQQPVRFELIDEIPRNTMSKVLKRKLRETYLNE